MGIELVVVVLREARADVMVDKLLTDKMNKMYLSNGTKLKKELRKEPY